MTNQPEMYDVLPGMLAFVITNGDEHEYDGTFYLERVEEGRIKITLHENLQPALEANLDLAHIRTPEGAWGDFAPLLELVRANLTEYLREQVDLSDHDDGFVPALALTILPTRRSVATSDADMVAEFRPHMSAVMASLDSAIYQPRA